MDRFLRDRPRKAAGGIRPWEAGRTSGRGGCRGRGWHRGSPERHRTAPGGRRRRMGWAPWPRPRRRPSRRTPGGREPPRGWGPHRHLPMGQAEERAPAHGPQVARARRARNRRQDPPPLRGHDRAPSPDRTSRPPARPLRGPGSPRGERPTGCVGSTWRWMVGTPARGASPVRMVRGPANRHGPGSGPFRPGPAGKVPGSSLVRSRIAARPSSARSLGSRHYILKLLRRRGLVFRDGSNWTNKHLHWLRSLLSQEESVAKDRGVLGEYLALLEYKIDRRDELDRRIERIAVTPAFEEAVGRLRGLCGLDTHGAMVLRSELGDLRRFGSPRQLMAYGGLVPGEHSSGSRENRGSITKAGNSHCRHVLVQAVWSYRYPPRVGARLSIGSTSCSAGSRSVVGPASPSSPSPGNSPASSGPCSRTSTPRLNLSRRGPLDPMTP
jgi:hypothetical protein